MKSLIKVAFLASITTAALVYVMLEWRPLRLASGRNPEVSWAGAEARPVAFPGAATAAGPDDPDEQNNIEIYRKYSAGVVNIASTTLTRYFIYEAEVPAGTGSGVIVDANGNIVTNYHVIQPALNGGELEVTLSDKTRFKAKIVGYDGGNDLAVIRIDAPKAKLDVVPLGTSTGLLVGQKVLAIGNPFGYEQTLTTGIISALGRSIQAPDGRIIENLVQTDAAINPGNSGGPLLNRAGEIIGINAAIISPSQTGNVGIGFAIPADTVRRVVADLITYGYVKRPYTGLSSDGLFPMEAFPEELADQLGIPAGRGFMVIGLPNDSPLKKAGVKVAPQQIRYGRRIYPVGGDILVGFQGKDITSLPELATAIDHFKSGDKVTFAVIRGNQKTDVSVVLPETPPPPNARR